MLEHLSRRGAPSVWLGHSIDAPGHIARLALLDGPMELTIVDLARSIGIQLAEELEELCAARLHSHAHHRPGKLSTREATIVVHIPCFEDIGHAIGCDLLECFVHL